MCHSLSLIIYYRVTMLSGRFPPSPPELPPQYIYRMGNFPSLFRSYTLDVTTSRAKPKSATLQMWSSVIRMFLAAKSRWIICKANEIELRREFYVSSSSPPNTALEYSETRTLIALRVRDIVQCWRIEGSSQEQNRYLRHAMLKSPFLSPLGT